MRYRFGELVLGGNLRFQSDSYVDFANTAELNSFVTADLNASYRYKDVTVSAFVNNVFDRKYFSNGYIDPNGAVRYFVQAPVNFYVAVS